MTYPGLGTIGDPSCTYRIQDQLPFLTRRWGQDPDTLLYLNALAAGGGSASILAIGAVAQWILDEKSGGADTPWPSIVAAGKGHVNHNIGDFVSCKIPQIAGDGGAADTFVGYVSADYTQAGGLIGAGDTSKYIFSNAGGLISLQTDFHHWQYMTGAVNVDVANLTQNFIGAGDFYLPYGGDLTGYLDVADSALRYTANSPFTLPYGMVGFSYKHGGTVQIFQGATGLGVTTSASGVVAGTAAYLYYQSAMPRKGYGVGLSMTAAQWTIHAAATLRLNTTLGRA